MSFLFGALPIDTLKIKHSEKLKEISSRNVLENLPEKSKHNGMEIAKLPDYCLGSYFTKAHLRRLSEQFCLSYDDMTIDLK